MPRLLKRSQNTFFCFSPPVMIATIIIEVTLAVYTVWRYKLTPIVRLAALMFASLAVFQLAEYMVCRDVGDGMLWSRIGYVAITALPPLGLHMYYAMTKTRNRPLVAVAYLNGLAFVSFFLLAPDAFTGQVCLGNYVIFSLLPGSGWMYALYYYGWLAAVLVLCWKYLRQAKGRGRRTVQGLAAGYAVFLIPAATAGLLKPETLVAMPSIMCGFAVLLAIIMAFTVLPAAAEKRKR